MGTGASLIKDEATGFLKPSSNYSIAGFTPELKTKFIGFIRNEYNIGAACKAVGIGRSYFYEMVNRDAEFKRQLQEALESHVDDAESNIVEMSKKGNGITAAIFLLKNRRKEVYGERVSLMTDRPELLVALFDRMTKNGKVIEGQIVETDENMSKTSIESHSIESL